MRLALLATLLVASNASAQDFMSFDSGHYYHSVIRVAQDYTLRKGETTRDVVVIYSPATIEGEVSGDLTVIFGELRLASTAVVHGSVYVIGGNAIVQPDASINRDLVVAGGTLDAPAAFRPGGEHVVIGLTGVTDHVRSVVPWLTEGLLLGRPIVPRLAWVWAVVAITLVISIVLCLMFPESVRLCADTIAAKPLSTFLVGLLVLLLTGPVSVILAVSVIGIAVIPFLLCALFIAWIIGKVGVGVRIGDSLVAQTPPATRLQSVRSLVIGFALISFAYMVPLLGFVVWALVGVVGMGAAALAFVSAYRRENPLPPKKSPPIPPRFEPPPPVTEAEPLAIDEPGLATLPASGSTTDLTAFPRATFLERAAAFLLDVVLVAVVNETVILARYENLPIFLLLAYHIGFWTWKGTTVGGIICQLRVVRIDGSQLRFVDALVRALSSLFSFAVFGLGVLWILRDPDRQAWHDKIAGTYVVKVPRNWPLP